MTVMADSTVDAGSSALPAYWELDPDRRAAALRAAGDALESQHQLVDLDRLEDAIHEFIQAYNRGDRS